MTDRDRLIELLYPAVADVIDNRKGLVEIADYLLSNGIIVPPCKVGDKLYCVTNLTHSIAETVVIGMWIGDGTFSILTIHGVIVDGSIGKTVFLTKSQAEEALKNEQEKL